MTMIHDWLIDIITTMVAEERNNLQRCEWCHTEIRSNRKTRWCSKPHYKECEYCGKSFQIKEMKRPAKTCSSDCSHALSRVKAKTQKNVCELCGKTFLADRSTSRFCSRDHYRNCSECGKRFKIANPFKPAKTCSTTCAWKSTAESTMKKKRKTTNLERYGVENPSQNAVVKAKKTATNLRRRGVENPSQDPEVQTRRTKTFQERYGAHPLTTPAVRRKIAATMKARYGVQNPFELAEFQTKAKMSVIERYGVENVFQLPEIQKRAANANGKRISKLNKQWKHKLEEATGLTLELEVPFDNGKRHADLGYENVLIDLNPSFTHNSAVSFVHLTGRCKTADCHKPSHQPRPANYHRERAIAAAREGKILLQWFDWMDESIFINIVQSKLRKLPIRIHGRTCVVKEITQSEANRFLRENHLLGASNKQTFCLGMFHENTLVHVQTYGESRFNVSAEWEAIRSCSKIGHHIPGAFSRCDTHFFRTKNPTSVISYVDMNTSHGNTESKFSGWTALKHNKPSITWVRMNNDTGKPAYIRDSTARRVSADRILGFKVGERYGLEDSSGNPISNAQILLNEGYLPVYDAGTKTFIWTR